MREMRRNEAKIVPWRMFCVVWDMTVLRIDSGLTVVLYIGCMWLVVC